MAWPVLSLGRGAIRRPHVVGRPEEGTRSPRLVWRIACGVDCDVNSFLQTCSQALSWVAFALRKDRGSAPTMVRDIIFELQALRCLDSVSPFPKPPLELYYAVLCKALTEQNAVAISRLVLVGSPGRGYGDSGLSGSGYGDIEMKLLVR